MPSPPISIPPVGLGLWKIDRNQVAELIEEAIQVGYRHLDSACDYGNEAEAGAGIRRAPRHRPLPPRGPVGHVQAVEHLPRPGVRPSGGRADPSVT